MKNYLIIIILIIILYELLCHPSLVTNCALTSAYLWFHNIFPTLLPFFTISNLLINYGFINIIGTILNPIFNRLFNVSPSSSYIIIMSLFSGIPSNAKYITDLYNNKYIDENEGTKLLCFTFFSNPLFILGSLSTNMLGNKNIGYLILLCHYLPNLFIGIYLRKYYINKNNNYSKRISNNNFGQLITNSLLSGINTLLLILGIIFLFSLITNILIYHFNINKIFISSILEITNGLSNLSSSNLSMKLKTILGTMILSFGGLSSHMQIVSIISETKIKYKPFLISRIIHSLLSGLLVILIY